MLSLNEAICGTLSQGSKSIWDGVLKKREGLSAFQLEEAEDAKLVALTLSGNSKSFEVLVRRYQKLVYNVIYQMIQSHETAADLTQDTFLKSYRALASFRSEARFKPWILRIASNTTLNHIRDSKARAHDSLEEILGDNPLAEPPSADDVEAEVELRFSQAMLAEALQSLPDRHRQVFVLRYQHDLSYADIATVVDEPETTIKSLLFRIREKLRKMLVEQSTA
ncbi:MAG: RNA polymerase sigma factor [Candidatus Obscuribacterales bacterium]|nr:RNA polymerase sigma factor [Candidatus Obscuribacterales bacterium]